MAGFPSPTAAFNKVALEIATLDPGERYGRIFLSKYPDPLGFGKTPSRFSDPRPLDAARRFGILYLGSTLKVCFVEAVLRDLRNGAVGDYPMEWKEFTARTFAEIDVRAPLNLVDLRDDGRIRMGIPSDVTGASDQAAGQAWSAAIHEHPAAPDGIIYSSRLNNEVNLAIYDRAIAKLTPGRQSALAAAPGIATLLRELKVAIL